MLEFILRLPMMPVNHGFSFAQNVWQALLKNSSYVFFSQFRFLNVNSINIKLSMFSLVCFLMTTSLFAPQLVQAKDAYKILPSKKLCGQDVFEPNDLRSRARNLSKELKDNREVSAAICKGDHDWYTVWLNKGDLVEFTISSALDKSPRLSVYAPRKRKASGIMHKVSPSMSSLKLYAKKSGRYRLHIEPSHEARSAYTLSYYKPMY